MIIIRLHIKDSHIMQFWRNITYKLKTGDFITTKKKRFCQLICIINDDVNTNAHSLLSSLHLRLSAVYYMFLSVKLNYFARAV